MTGLAIILSQLNFVQFLGWFVCEGTCIYWADLNLRFFQYFAIFWFACFSRSFSGWAGLYTYVKSSYNVAKAELIEGNTVFSNLLL